MDGYGVLLLILLSATSPCQKLTFNPMQSSPDQLSLIKRYRVWNQYLSFFYLLSFLAYFNRGLISNEDEVASAQKVVIKLPEKQKYYNTHTPDTVIHQQIMFLSITHYGSASETDGRSIFVSKDPRRLSMRLYKQRRKRTIYVK